MPKRRYSLHESLKPQPQPQPQPNPSSSAIPSTQSAPSVQASMLQDLKHILDTETRCATFTCGGKLPISLHPNVGGDGNLTPRTEEKVNDQRILTKGVTIRWGGDGEGQVITLPSQHAEAVEDLVKACVPATFALGGKDVLDETYRRAGALATDKFTTDFCPYEAGIIDIITQMLLPPITGDLEPESEEPKRHPLTARFQLTHRQEKDLWYAWEKYRGSPEGHWIPAKKLKNCLQNLQIGPQSAEELSQILGSLDPVSTGIVDEQDFLSFAAQRMKERDSEGNGRIQAEKAEKESKRKRMVRRGLRAELYKLNVYSGPEGKFKAHVDTPRSEYQVGSLVVCLPVPFEGGGLAVRHQKEEVVYDWSTSTSKEKEKEKEKEGEASLQWAAFYSDCTHEVHPVTSGHRITLTYNLFLSPGTSLLTTRPTSLDAPRLPLTLNLGKMLRNEHFLPEGGYLGMHLTHAYPHTHPKLGRFVPQMLKGVDMVVYESVACLCLPMVLGTVGAEGSLPSFDFCGMLDNMAEEQAKQRRPSTAGAKATAAAGAEANAEAPTPPPFHNTLHPFEARSIDTENGDDVDDINEDRAAEKVEEWKYEKEEDVDDEMGSQPSDEELREWKRRFDARDKICWINGGDERGREVGGVYMVYGNQAELEVKYSRAAIVIGIPELKERIGETPERQRFKDWIYDDQEDRVN